jgi:hypothetical protein
MVALLFACAYEVPLDPDAPAVLNVLSGTVVVNGAEAVADTVILVYTADNPPPPTGTGRPVTFTTVPAESYATDIGGVPSANWAITEVPDGDYLVTALMDVDGNFQPLLTATAGSTCGDWLGAYFTDILTSEYATVSATGGLYFDGITVAIGLEMPIQRPAFSLQDDSSVDTVIQPALGSPFTLLSTAVHSEIYELPGPFDGTAACQTAFWQYAPDDDGDGTPNPHPNENFAAAGFTELWPRLYLRYLGAVDEGYIASEALASASVFGGLPPVNTLVPATELPAIFTGKAIHFHDDGTEELLEGDAIPTGLWSLTAVQFTGQTWTLPNELAAYGATDETFDPLEQGVMLTME